MDTMSHDKYYGKNLMQGKGLGAEIPLGVEEGTDGVNADLEARKEARTQAAAGSCPREGLAGAEVLEPVPGRSEASQGGANGQQSVGTAVSPREARRESRDNQGGPGRQL